MKNKNVRVLTLVALAGMGLVACNPLNKMSKKADLVKYDVSPNPLEMHGDSVELTISGKYPEKYFNKKVSVDVTPTLFWEGGQKEFKTTTLQGEAVEGEGTVIKSTGGSFNFNDKIPYVKGMDFSELKLVATGNYKTKSKELGDLKIGDGTIVTPLLVQSDEKPIMAKDKFVRTTSHTLKGDIHYSISSATVSSSETRKDDIKAISEFIKENKENEKVAFKGASISAYASPDGEIDKNENLANDRANSAAKSISGLFKRNKVEAGTADEFYNKVGMGEDWDGFKAAMQSSEIKDKELIIRILEMYSDKDKREVEIKNLAATYTEVAKQILPELRRSQLTINYDLVGKSDEEISALAKSAPDSLNVEELLYAASLTSDINEKLSIYQSAQKVYADDWRGHNNVGYIYLTQGKLNDAETALNTASEKAPNEAIVNNNLGIVARWKGDVAKAKELYENAKSAGSEVNYNLAIIAIMEGDYGTAVSNFGSEKTFNTALAKLLNADAEGAIKTVDASDAKTEAIGYYLKAIAGARTDNKDLMVTNLKTAIEKDASLREKAGKDAEFVKYRQDEAFTSIVK